MTKAQQFIPSRGIVVDVALCAVFAAGLAVMTYLLMDSWGGASWQFTCGTGAAVCLLALIRRLDRAWTAVAGVTVAAAATLIAWLADLPAEPNPVTTLALSVLAGSAIRGLSGLWSAAIVVAWFGLTVGIWALDGFTTMVLVNTLGWFAAVGTGLYLRVGHDSAADRQAVT